MPIIFLSDIYSEQPGRHGVDESLIFLQEASRFTAFRLARSILPFDNLEEEDGRPCCTIYLFLDILSSSKGIHPLD